MTRDGAGPTVVGASVIATDVVVAFGFVVGFNQLATQSPVDAILPIALFSVGLGGLLAFATALLATALRTDVGDSDGVRVPSALDPPTLDQGFAAFGLGLLAVAAVGWRWGVAAQAALVAAQGLALLLSAERGIVLTLRDAPERPAAYRLCLMTPEAVLLVGFAWSALADAGIRPFS